MQTISKYDDDNVPLRIVQHNLYRTERIKKANMQLKLDKLHMSNQKRRTPIVRLSTTIREHSYEEWEEKWSHYASMNNRKCAMVYGVLVTDVKHQ
jgi:hypothetical protein